jgi:hypothetical protein
VTFAPRYNLKMTLRKSFAFCDSDINIPAESCVIVHARWRFQARKWRQASRSDFCCGILRIGSFSKIDPYSSTPSEPEREVFRLNQGGL